MAEEIFMKRCFDLAKKGLGNVAPNPMVGAVIVHNGKIIGEGYHQQYGQPHAEVNAIASVKNRELLKKSVLYVNLEPCSHYGKTPPCANLIIAEKIPEVVIANNDPFPKVSGRGIKLMKEAGIKVTEGFMQEEGWRLNRRFFTFHTRKRPYIILKWAQTMNGFIDCRDTLASPPLQISNTETAMLSHKLRAEESAILVGTNTALLDNPELTVRKWYGKNPVRILIDRDLRVPASHRIFNNKSTTIVFTEKKPVQAPHPDAEYIEVPFTGKGHLLPIKVLLEKLYNKNIQSLIVEGGNGILNSFIQSDMWDEMRVETATQLTVTHGVPAPPVIGKCIKKSVIGDHIIEWFANL